MDVEAITGGHLLEKKTFTAPEIPLLVAAACQAEWVWWLSHP